jgi:hypothetical protein
LFSSFQGKAQPIEEKTHKESVRTVQIHRKGEPLTLPVINLNSDDQLTLSFDDLDANYQTYSYKIIHCDARWHPSNLSQNEYLAGMFQAEIQNHQSSFNTIIPYRHYELDIPNENMKPLISGNYTLVVFQNYNEQDTILTRRFRISENTAHITPEMHTFNRMSPDKPNQQLEMKINTGSVFVSNPYSELKIAVKKNYHNERLIEKIDPSSMQGNTLVYRNVDQMAFKGGNEFRYFNTKSKNYASENIQRIDFIQNNFHFRLKPDTDRSFEEHKAQKEINGRFRIDKERTANPDLEADYVYVYFTLKDKTPELEGGVYVTGGFNKWKKNESSKMNYNMEQNAYEKRILLKQGYYNYRYVLKNYAGYDPYFYSGNKHQTENEYQVFIYYKDFSKGYDRLIGHANFNSSSMQF